MAVLYLEHEAVGLCLGPLQETLPCSWAAPLLGAELPQTSWFLYFSVGASFAHLGSRGGMLSIACTLRLVPYCLWERFLGMAVLSRP